MLLAAERNGALPGLRDFVFQHHEVDPIGIDIVEATLSRQYRANQLRPVPFGFFAQPASLFDPGTTGLPGEWNCPDFEVDVVFVVHRDFENHHVGALDRGIDHLPVDEIDVGHAKEESNVLSVWILRITSNAPLRLFDRDDRVAKHHVVVHRIAVALMDEAHVDTIQRGVDIVEIVTNPPERRDIEGNLGGFESRIPWQRRGRAFPQISEDQPNIFLDWITRDAYFVGKQLFFRGLLHTLSRAVVLPTMIKAADAFAFNRTDGELSAAMRTAWSD